MAAAREAGALLRRHLHSVKRANEVTRHDIKLELDVRCQKLIERRLRRAFPAAAVVGEEGILGDPQAEHRWVVDPIDGTVNFSYQIPHACVSIALQRKGGGAAAYEDGYETVAGVVYDPFCEETWTAFQGKPAFLNGKRIHVGSRNKLAECVVSIGFTKSRESLEATLPYFSELARQVRKIRMMGSATLALVYVASGRFDAYIEREIRLWDIAAGGLILESAGGEFWRESTGAGYQFRMLASNGSLRRLLRIP